MEKLILSVDCGTQSLRVLLFSLKGELIDMEKIPFEPYCSEHPGWAEQDPELYWKSLCKASSVLKKRNPENFRKICGVGVTTLRNTLVNVDKEGKPLRPAVVWLDQRKAEIVYSPTLLMRAALKIIRMDEVVEKMQKEGKCNWIRQQQPGVWAKTYKYLQVSGFLNFRLTGQFADSVASQIGHLPFNYRQLKWGDPKKPFAISSKIYPVEKEKLPVLVQPGTPIGKITGPASRQTGIPEGLPVVACGSDKGCETIGMGVLDHSMASLSFGTAATIQTTSARYFEPKPFMPAYPASYPGRFNPEIEIFRGFWMVTWFKNEFAQKEEKKALSKGIPVEVVLNKLLKKTPPGSMGLIVQPYWSPSLSEPSAKGAMIGFGDVHKKAHVYRAVIEGLAFGLLEGMYRIEKKGRFKFRQLAVSGGASQSNEICQISADVFNLPIVRGTTFETSGLGAAILTALGTNCFNSIEEAIESMVSYQHSFEPNPENAKLYNHLYKRVYRKMYKSLEPLYKEIREITGYPG